MRVVFMNKFFVGLLLGISFLIAACGGSSSNEAKDPCTDDPNLPECAQNEGEKKRPVEEEVEKKVVEEPEEVVDEEM